MFTEILSDTAGQAALSRFFTTNTWNAQQIFKAATTTAPGFVAQATGTISAISAVDANAIALFQGTEAVAGHVQFSASGSATHVVFRRNNGTYASPTAVANADVIGSLQWQGRGASTFGTVPSAQIRGVAVEAFSETARGASLEFYTIAPTTITSTLRLTLGASASFTVPVVTTSNFQISGSAGTTRDFFWRTSGSTRFIASINATAESGSNAGSDFEIRRYSDAGADLGLVMAVTRSTGNITFNGGGGITSFAANKIQITTAQTPATSAAAGNAGDIAWDDTYLYVRMSTGWRRIALGAAF